MANDWTGALGLVAVYNFESGALTTDSYAGNTLAPSVSPPTADTANHKQGAASADFEADNSQYYLIVDAGLPEEWPLKDGESNFSMSFTVWVRLESHSGSLRGVIGKAGSLAWVIYSDYISMVMEWPNGNISVMKQSIAVSTGQWYFLAFTYDHATRAYRLHIWDDVAGASLGDVTGTVGLEFGDAPTLAAGAFGIGLTTFAGTNRMDGQFDELTVWNRALTTEEIDLIRQGNYASSSSSSSSSFSSSSSSSQSSSSSYSSSSSFVPLQWPVLSKGVEFDTQEMPGAHDVTMPLGHGQTKTRPRYTRRPHRWRIRLRLLTLADRLALEKFYLVDCRRGKYTFEFLEQGMNQTWLVRWDPDEPVKFTHEERSPGKFRMDGVVLEDCAGSYGSGQYGAQYYDS